MAEDEERFSPSWEELAVLFPETGAKSSPAAKPEQVTQPKTFLDEDAEATDEVALAHIFKALGNTNRMEIISLLSMQPASAGDMALALELAPNLLSHHLKALEQAGIVSVQRQ